MVIMGIHGMWTDWREAPDTIFHSVLEIRNSTNSVQHGRFS
jgi:hypothetical protein